LSSSSTKLSEILQAIDQVLQSAENQSPVDFMAKLPEYNQVLHLVREYLQRSPLPPPPPPVTNRAKEHLPPPPPPPAKTSAKTAKKITAVPPPPPPKKKLPPPLPPMADPTGDLVKKRQELLKEIAKLEKQRQEKWAIAQQYSQQQKVIQEFCQALLPVVQENINNYFSLWQSYGQSNVSLLNQFIGMQSTTDQLPPQNHSQQIETNRPIFPSKSSPSQVNQDFLESNLLLHSQINTPINFPSLGEVQPTTNLPGEVMPYPGYEYPKELVVDSSPETVLVSLPNMERAIAPDFTSLDNSSTNLNQINTDDLDTDDFDVSSMGDLAPSIDTHPYKVASPDENLLPNADLVQLVPNLELFLDIEIVEKLQKELDLLESFNNLDDDEDVTIIQNDTTWLNAVTVEEQNIFTAPDHAHLHRINPFDTEDFEQDLPDLVGLLREMPTADQSDNTTGEIEQINMKTTLSDVIANFHSEYTNLQDSSLDNSLDNLQLGDLADLMTENSKWFQAGHQISEGKPSQEKLSSSPPPVQSLNQPVSPPQTSNQVKKNSTNSPLTSDWYLGIDFGSTGMAASLLHKASGEIYPLTWQAIATPIVDPSENSTSLEENVYAMHRLPCQVYWQANTDSPRTKLENFKSCLQITLPYTQVDVKRQKITTAESFVATISLEATTNQEPMLQWSPQQAISLETIRKSLIVLLGNLRPVNVPLRPNLLENPESLSLPNYYVCNADGLDANTLNTALQELKGVILGCPAGWSEAYRYNLREAVLSAGLVQNINQVMIIEDAIATALSILTVNQKTGKSWRAGKTLIINLGASTSQIALVNLPADIAQINYSDFICRSFAYGGYALDQDIICQLLLPSNHQQSFPQVAHRDLGIRYQLQQWLNNSPVRQSLWETAEKLKMILPTEENFTLQLADQVWQIDRQNLEKSVLIPYLQQLNSQLNNFLAEIGVSAVAINQAICTGGGSQWGAIARWLRQKLPNAVLTIDQETNIPQRVAHGLACLPLYPQLATNPEKPYSDYFILWEILRAFPEQQVNINEIYQILEKRGINTQACQGLIKQILDGHLPAGLIPTGNDLAWLTTTSQNNPDYQRAIAAPLFIKDDQQKYDLNYEQAHQLIDYLNKLVAQCRQKLDEPL
jgi:hypothetical protein